MLLVGCGSGEVTDLGVRDGGPARDAGEARDAGAVRDGGPRDGGPTIEPCVPGFVEIQPVGLPAQLTPTPLPAKVTAEVGGFNLGVAFFYEQNGEPASGVAGLRFGTNGGLPVPLFAMLKPTRVIHGIFDHGAGRVAVFSGGVATNLDRDGVAVAFFGPASTRPETVRHVQTSDDFRGVAPTSTEVVVLTQTSQTVSRRLFSVDAYDTERFSIDSNRPALAVTVDTTTYLVYDAGDLTSYRLGVVPLLEGGPGEAITVDLPETETVVGVAAFGSDVVVLFSTGERLRLALVDPFTGDLAWGADLDRSLRDGTAELAAIDGTVGVAYFAEGAQAPEVHLFDAELQPIADAPFVPDVRVLEPRLGMSFAGGRDTFALATSEGESGTVRHTIVFFDACSF